MTLQSYHFIEVASLLIPWLKGETALTQMEESIYKEISYALNHKRFRWTSFMNLKSSENHATDLD